MTEQAAIHHARKFIRWSQANAGLDAFEEWAAKFTPRNRRKIAAAVAYVLMRGEWDHA